MKNRFRSLLDKGIRWRPRKRKAPRPSMDRGLKWLAGAGFKAATVLDVGASNGAWSSRCIPFFPEADYVLFDPLPAHGEALDRFAMQCTQKVTVVKKAVGGASGTAHLLFDPEDPYSGALHPEVDGRTVEVQVTTMDQCLLELGTSGPYLLKLDTHGYERSILEGAAGTLEETEVLIVEAYNYPITGETLLFWELCAYLHERGFRPVDLVDVAHRRYDGSLWQMDLFFVRSDWDGFEYTSYR